MSNRADRGSELLLGAVHFLVDFSCTALLTASCVGVRGLSAALCAVLYNGCAFAMQLPIGYLADRLSLRRTLAAGGCVLVAAGSLFAHPLVLCLLIGLGNACFHVGGGRETLQCGGARAARIGRFVAPGAFGIFLGPLSAGKPLLVYQFAPLLLGLSALLLLAQKQKNVQKEKLPAAASAPLRLFVLCGCMFLTVLLRSYMGTVTRYAAFSEVWLAALLTLSVFFGKFFGGSLADRFGAFRFSLLAQPIGTALYALSVVQPLFALPATLLFNTTMAITAHTLYRCAPHRSGTMFGLTTLALYLGVLPRLLGAPNPLFTWWGLALIGLGSTALLLLGLRLAQREGKRLAC